jgi:FkbH-like protein
MSTLEFNQLIAQAARLGHVDGLKKVKIALLGDSTTQFLHRATVAAGQLAGIAFEVLEADFGQIERQVFDPGSELYLFEPDVVVIAYTAKKLLAKFYGLAPGAQRNFAADKLTGMRDLVEMIGSQSKAKILLWNIEELDDKVFGHFANKIGLSFINQVRRLNVGLMDLAESQGNVFIIDIASLHSRVGRAAAYAPHIYVSTDLVHSLNFTAMIASAIADVVNSIVGRFKKCVILDLDNTTWGGIIGDDGIENIEVGNLGLGKVFVELQRWVKALKDRGIIVAVCSKNTESVAKEPFEKHPDMVLRLDDIAVFVANWENKADNIRHIQEILNIGFDSMVFLDDNPVERQIVRENLPDVTVPELPEDPAEYLEFLYGENLFETASYSNTDAERTRQYQEEASRHSLSQKFTNVGEFLKSLDMKAFVRPFSDFDVPRVAQLSQRSNQFNLRTVRYTEEDIRRIAADPNYVTFAFNLADKFGDNGLIAVVILEKRANDELFIDTWFMSCRVLKRSMEAFTLHTLVEAARDRGYKRLVGEYIATAKNAMVAEHYAGLGFEEQAGFWYLAADAQEPSPFYIELVTTEVI